MKQYWCYLVIVMMPAGKGSHVELGIAQLKPSEGAVEIRLVQAGG
ncbi:hypothetical protein QFZ77_006159 [Paenibacillus sp. V4I3]|nr:MULTISPECIES: hypothetical protein [unclassified Paenibacillus]MDQ0877500.1 hypothetical protein [Paenibacillus sp. V4I3]MDQ0886634.1 hypothetical protein [Paenibacillus sp. V4I9]